MQILSRYIEGPFKGTISSMEGKQRIPQDSWSWGLNKYCYRFGLEMSAPGRRSCWKCILFKPFDSLKDVSKASQKMKGGGEEKERIKNGANSEESFKEESFSPSRHPLHSGHKWCITTFLQAISRFSSPSVRARFRAPSISPSLSTSSPHIRHVEKSSNETVFLLLPVTSFLALVPLFGLFLPVFRFGVHLQHPDERGRGARGHLGGRGQLESLPEEQD